MLSCKRNPVLLKDQLPTIGYTDILHMCYMMNGEIEAIQSGVTSSWILPSKSIGE